MGSFAGLRSAMRPPAASRAQIVPRTETSGWTIPLPFRRVIQLGKFWRRVAESNLSRIAGVSEAGARRRNPERAKRVEGPQLEEWRRVAESNLSRIAGVSEAGARRRNPERAKRVE